MKRYGCKWTVACVAILAATASVASAQKITDDQINDLIRVAAERAGVTPGRSGAAPTAAQTDAARTADDTRAKVSLSLDDAIKLALDRNLDIAVQRLNPQTFDFSIANLRAVYNPLLTSNVARQSATTAPTTTVSGGTAVGVGILAETNTYNAGLSQSLKWGGGNVALTFNNQKFSTTSQTALFNPLYTPNYAATYTQPLMRNLKIDSTRRSLVVTKLNQDISELQLQQTIINTVSNVREAYWNYVYSVQAVDVARQSLSLAEQLVKDNQIRVDVGTMAPIDVVQAQSQAAAQRNSLAAAIQTQRTNELALKRLIVSGTDDNNWAVNIDPVDRPDFTPQPIDIPAAVRRAIENRTDLAVVKKNLAINDVTYKYLNNQLLPQADVQLRYNLVGQGGVQYISTGNGVNRVVTGVVPGGFSDALSTLVHTNYPTWSATLNFSYPLGTSAQEANVARAKVQMNQVEAQRRQIELQIATDVTNAGVTVQSTAERVQAAQAARELAQKQLEAEQSKFQVGMSTNYFIVQAQRDLATAQTNELQAILAYRTAQVELERLQQTTLSTSNITLISASGGTGALTVQ